MIGNLLRAMQVLDIGFEDAVQDVVRRQAVLVLLVGTQLGRRRLLNGRSRDQFPLAINPGRQLINHQFRHIGNHRKTAGHISVKSAVSDREF